MEIPVSKYLAFQPDEDGVEWGYAMCLNKCNGMALYKVPHKIAIPDEGLNAYKLLPDLFCQTCGKIMFRGNEDTLTWEGNLETLRKQLGQVDFSKFLRENHEILMKGNDI